MQIRVDGASGQLFDLRPPPCRPAGYHADMQEMAMGDDGNDRKYVSHRFQRGPWRALAVRYLQLIHLPPQ